MSQKASRKGVLNEEKEKTDTPVKEMKKKIAANAEKEKHAEKKDTEKPADKSMEKNEKADKAADKSTEKVDKPEKRADKVAEKVDKPEKRADKVAEKVDKYEKKVDKVAEKVDKFDKKADKTADKKTDKSAEKKAEPPVEKREDKNEKSGQSEKPDQKKPDRPKQNGKETRGVNGTANGDENGTVSADDDDEDAMVIDDTDHDEMFPELTYDDTSDPEFEPPTPEASRSFTRRSQSKDSKVLKLKEEAPVSTDRKLRSADSPKPGDKKEKGQDNKESPKKEGDNQEEKENGAKTVKEANVVIEIDCGDDEPRKTDTNYSKSRVKVSPYRRSVRLADQTTSSMMANYTGNNTTMEMDITETTSSFMSEDPSLDDSSYLSGLRSIRGRRSYKPLKEMTLRHVVNKSQAKPVSVHAPEQPSRPTAPVVGRKRKPEGDDSIELGTEASEGLTAAHSKRMRLFDRFTTSFRRTVNASTPLPARRAAEIVGINSDLPLSAPVAAAALDPEALKQDAPAAVPLTPAPASEGDRDSKRCVVM